MNDIVNGFWCAGPWFDGKLPNDFASIKLFIYVSIQL